MTFSKNLLSLGTLANWVCQNSIEYLDLKEHRFDLQHVESDR